MVHVRDVCENFNAESSSLSNCSSAVEWTCTKATLSSTRVVGVAPVAVVWKGDECACVTAWLSGRDWFTKRDNLLHYHSSSSTRPPSPHPASFCLIRNAAHNSETQVEAHLYSCPLNSFSSQDQTSHRVTTHLQVSTGAEATSSSPACINLAQGFLGNSPTPYTRARSCNSWRRPRQGG